MKLQQKIQHRKEHFNAKLPKMLSIFLPNHQNTNTTDDVSSVSMDISATSNMDTALLTDPSNSDSGAKSKSHCPADDRHCAKNITEEVAGRPTCYPSDRANFHVDLTDACMKRAILNLGPCKPDGPFPRENNGRCLSKDFYLKWSKTGTVPLKLLCYSSNTDRDYCKPCWLFGNRKCPSHHPSWAVGITDCQGLSGRIKKH